MVFSQRELLPRKLDRVTRSELEQTAADAAFAEYRETRDPAALARVFDATAGKLLLVAMHVVRDAARAEDLVQATFLAAIRGAERYEPGRPVTAWLVGILSKQAAFARRQDARQVDPDRLPASVGRDPVDAALDAELVAEVGRALDRIPQPYRQVLVLRLVHGLGGIEIARVVERSPRTVRSQLHRGLELLRSALPRGLAPVVLAMFGVSGHGLAAVRAAVLAEARALAPVAGASGSFASAGVIAVAGGTVLKKVLVAACAAALAVALVVFAVGRWGGDRLPAVSSGVVAPRVAAVTPVDESDITTDSGVRADVARDAVPRVKTAQNGPQVRVRVVDARTGVPVEGAIVAACPDAEAIPVAERSAFRAIDDVEARALRFGESWRTGEDGAVLVPRPDRSSGDTFFTARSGDLYGEGRYSPLVPGEVWLHVEPDRTLRVCVVDDGGAPAEGVEVRWIRKLPDEALPRSTPAGITDGEGCIVVRHTQLRAEEWSRVDPVAMVESSVVPCLPGVSHAGVVVDPRDPPPERIVLRLPPTGSLVIELANEQRQLVPRRFAARVIALGPAGDVVQRWAWDSPELIGGTDGRAVVPRVGLGTRFRVSTTVAGAHRVDGEGPRSPGKAATLRLLVDPDVPVLRGRITDASCPGGSVQVRVRVRCGTTWRSAIVPLDEHGTFRYSLDRSLIGDTVQCVQVVLAGEQGVALARMAVSEPAEPLPPGELDLGELVLVEPPLVAAGIVVDDAGVPIDTINLDVRAASDEGRSRRVAEFVHVVVAPDGRFVIRGFPTSDDLVLMSGVFSSASSLPFRRGDTDLRLVVPRLAKLGVVVRHDLPPDCRSLLRAELIPCDGGELHRSSGSSLSPITRDARLLRFSEIPPGRYTLVVRIAGDHRPLATVEDVDVGRGVVDDPRLWSIDVRGKLRLARVRLLDSTGRPVRSEGRLTLEDHNPSFRHLDFTAGELLLPIASRPVAATVRVPGWREVSLAGIDGDLDVRLSAALEARIELVPDLGLPLGLRLHAFLQPFGQPPNSFLMMIRGSRGPIIGSGQPASARPGPGRFVFEVPRPGEYAVTFVLATTDEQRSVALPARPNALTVREGAPLEVRFTTDLNRVADAILALRQ